jgi:hypothetical protein
MRLKGVPINQTSGRVSLLAETRFTIYFRKGVDLRVLNYAPSPRGRGWRGTWRETWRSGPEAMGEG